MGEEGKRDNRIFLVFLFCMAVVIYNISQSEALPTPVQVSLSSNVDLHLGDNVHDPEKLCYILFEKTFWRVKPNGHPVFGDFCQYGVFRVRNFQGGDVLSNEPYEIEVCEDGFFNFCGYRFDVSFYNDTTVNLVLTPN